MADELTRRALVREVNAKICEVDAGFGVAGSAYHVLCECGRPGCHERFDVPASLYDALRASAGSFVVATGHERPHDEHVSRGADFAVVAGDPPPDVPGVTATALGPAAAG